MTSFGAFVEKDFVLQRGLTGVEAVSAERASTIAANIDKYGCSLMKLPEAAWQTSVCQWMEGYWDVLIDLYTVEEGESDLALVMRVYEKNESYNFVVQSVHVP